jgi:hypothetical protein
MRIWIEHFQKLAYMAYEAQYAAICRKMRNPSQFFFSFSTSVADPGCLSRIPDPDFYPSQIPDPKTAMKDRGEKKLSCLFLEPQSSQNLTILL